MFKKIAVAFDESAEAERAFRAALNLANLVSAELYLVTVIENLPAYYSPTSWSLDFDGNQAALSQLLGGRPPAWRCTRGAIFLGYGRALIDHRVD